MPGNISPRETVQVGLGTCTLAYEDGLQGSGQPVPNIISFGGQPFIPGLSGLETVVSIEPHCPFASPVLGFTRESTLTLGNDDTQGGLDDLTFLGEGKPLVVAGSPGESGSGTAYVTLRSAFDNGAQGWSLSVGTGGAIALSGATTVGTTAGSVGDDPPGIRNAGFEKTELVTGKGRCREVLCPGAVSAVVGSFTLPVALRPQGLATLLRLDFESTKPIPDEGTLVGQLLFVDGLRGSGQPVNNVLTVAGVTENPCALQSVDVIFEPVPVANTIQGDGNNDARIDIGDPIFLINFLFRDGREPDCAPALDANGDGTTDLADAAFAIQYLFFGGDALDLICRVLDGATPDNCSGENQVCAPSN